MKRIFKLSVAWIVMVMVLLMGTNVFAATIGEDIKTVETGWKRFDDSDSRIIYNGLGWWHVNEPLFTNSYNAFGSGVSSPTSSNSIKFRFYGTKLRLYGFGYSGMYSRNICSIDGVDYSMAQWSQIINNHSGLSLEVKNLDLENHIVVIRPNNSSRMYLDAIDIDDIGELLSYYQTTNLQATPGNSKVTLKWDAVPDAVGYIVKYGTSSGNYTTTLPSTTSDVYFGYDVTGLTNGITYYFTISAIVGGVEREASNEAVAAPRTSEPEAPTNLTATGGNSNVSLSWDEVTGATSYKIKRSTTSGGPYNTIATYETVTSTVYEDSSVEKGVTYYYVVTAVNTGGESTNSNEATITIPNKPVLNVTAVNDKVKVNEEFTVDVEEANCGDKLITVEGIKDVNRSGEFTLIDLAIDAWYYGEPVTNTDTNKYDTDLSGNGTIDEVDLFTIVDEMLNNSNYIANK